MSLSRRGFVGKVAGLASMVSLVGGMKLMGATKTRTDFTFGSVIGERTRNSHYVDVYLDGKRLTRLTRQEHYCLEANTVKGYVILQEPYGGKKLRRTGRVQILFQTPEMKTEYMERYGKYDKRYLA